MFNFFFFKSVVHFYFKFYFKQNKNVFFIYYKVLNSFKMLKKKFVWIKNVNFNNKELRCRLKTYSSELRVSKTFFLGNYSQKTIFMGSKLKTSEKAGRYFEDNLSGVTYSEKTQLSPKVNLRVQSRSITFPFSKKGRVI